MVPRQGTWIPRVRSQVIGGSICLRARASALSSAERVTLGCVAEAPRLITAAEMDRLTPDERAAAVNERIVTDWDDVPEAFRQKVITTAHRLAEDLDLHQPR